MKKNLAAKKRSTTALVLLALLLLLTLPSSGRAMNSANYRLDWYSPMTGVGGTSSSPNFSLSLTVGQSVTGRQASPGFAVNLGFWQDWGAAPVFLPYVVR